MCITLGGLLPCSQELPVEQFTEKRREKSAEGIVPLREMNSKGRPESVGLE